MSTTKTALFIIDMQNDFILPTGTLSVPGAMDDANRLATFILKNKQILNSIFVTLDSHHIMDIAHPTYWVDENDNHPPIFTGMNSNFLQDVKNGKWMPKFFYEQTLNYLEQLYSNGEYQHIIWPEHCIIGTEGAAIVKVVSDAISEWEREGNFKDVILKGTNPLTEHFGAFIANVPMEEYPETQLNINLINILSEFDTIYIAGEAKSHCVAATINQVIKYMPDIANRFIILDDCMSCVVGCDTLADPIFNTAIDVGMKIIKSTDVI